MDSIDNEIIRDQNLFTEKDISIVPMENSHRLSDSSSFENINIKSSVSHTAPTYSHKSLSKRSTSFMCAFRLGTFTIIVIITGVLTVYFTASKQQDQICEVMFKPILRNSTTQGSNPRSVAVSDFDNDTHLDMVVATYDIDAIAVYRGYGNGSFAMQNIYSTGYKSLPCSIAIGDLNNDIQPDIVVTNYGTNNVGIFLGYGNGAFANQQTYSTDSSRPLSVALGDVNNDTRLDIIVANSGTNTVGVLLGYGNGSFSKHISYSTGYDSFPQSVIIGDFNNDNQLDIAVANSGTNNVGVLLGYANGTFENQNIYPTGFGSSPFSIAAGDFNKDNHLDIAIANYGNDNIGILLGYGNGAFVIKATYSIGFGSRPYSVIVSDFNKDNLLDIVVTNYANDSIDVFIGYGNGSFARQDTYSTGFGPCSIAVGDFDNDNQLDLVVTTNGTNSIQVFMGYYPLLFPKTIQYPIGSTSRPQSVAVGDFNKDKQLDLVVANSGTNNIGVFMGYGNGTFASEVTYSNGNISGPYSVAVGDFNNDNRLDIVVANTGKSNIVVFLGYDNGTFAINGTYSTGFGSLVYAVAVGDLNNDNRLDIVVVNGFTNNVGIFIGYGNGTFTSQNRYSTGSFPQSVAIGDLNNDNHLDIAVANYGSDSVSIFLGYGNGTFTNQYTYSVGSGPCSIALADFNNDSWLDITVASRTAQIVTVLLGLRNGSFVIKIVYSVKEYVNDPQWVTVADFNYDKLLDIAFTDNYGLVSVLLGYGNGSFSADAIQAYLIANARKSLPITVGDFNNDSIIDIAVASYDFNNLYVILSYNYGRLVSQAIYSTGEASLPLSVAIGDFNNDTYPDIVVANSGSDNLGILLGYGDTTFANEIKYTTGYSSFPHSVTVGDLNNDNLLDLVVANYGTDNVGVLLGYENGTFKSQTTYSTGSNSGPKSVAVADLNNDNWLDIAVANERTDNVALLLTFDTGSFSKQIKYSPVFGSVPCSMAMGDLNNDSHLDIVVVNSNTNNINIFLGNNNETFENGNTYSTGSIPKSVSVGDFNNDKRLDIVVANSGSNNVVVFLGYGDGTFVIEGMYSTGNGSVPYAVTVGDLNNDNKLDIVVVNSGANNLGIFIGYGNGSFASQNTYSTGSSPQSVAIGDLNNDNQLDIIVANYDSDDVSVFRGYVNGSFTNQSTYSAGYKPCSIALGDLNNDSRLDIVVAGYLKYVNVLLAYSDGHFSVEKTYSFDSISQPWSVIVADINNDDRLDIVFSTAGTGDSISFPSPALLGYLSVGVLLGYGNGAFATEVMYSTGSFSGPFSILVGDFNSDNRLDIVIADFRANNICVIFGYKYVTFAAAIMHSTGNGSHPRSVTIGDFNNDNQLDIAVTNFGTDSVGVLLGSRNGTFTIEGMYSTGFGSHPHSVTVGDFNNDGRLDIVVANSNTDSIAVLFGYGNGAFVIGTTYLTGPSSVPCSVATCDFNRDNRLDIVVANYGTNNVGIFLGYDNGTFLEQTTYTFGFNSRPYSVAVGDFNNDTQLDVAVANYGSNNIEILLKLC